MGGSTHKTPPTGNVDPLNRVKVFSGKSVYRLDKEAMQWPFLSKNFVGPSWAFHIKKRPLLAKAILRPGGIWKQSFSQL
jgi:hypothetical protein